MLLSFSSNSVKGKQILHQKCIHFIALTIMLTLCTHAVAQEKFQLRTQLSQAICKASSLFSQENKIQPPLKYSSNFPPSNNPSCKTVQVILDWNADGQVCRKFFMCPGSTRLSDSDNNMNPDPNRTYKHPTDPSLPEVKIVGGRDARPHEFPYQARLFHLIDRFTFCGGSVLSPNYVLTAAHCMLNEDKADVLVILGDHDQSIEENTEQKVNIESVKSHENHLNTHGEHDIALLKVTPPLQLNQYVQPILLPRANNNPANGNAVASGWGLLDPDIMEQPRKLQKVTVPIIPFEPCQRFYDIPNFSRKVTKNQLCTGNTARGGIAPCKTDSGGPLAQKFPNGSYFLIGIISWSYSCAQPDFPSVYIKVSSYLDWIRAHMT